MTKKQSIPNSNPQRKRTPKLISRMLFLVVTLISFAAFVYAHDPQYDDQNYSFRAGYSAGYGHGDTDQRARTDFDFRHDNQYQNNNNNSRQDVNFRLGYVEGYADGFFHRTPLFVFQQQDGSHVQYNNGQYNNGQYNNGQYNQTYGSPNQGAITVFTGTGYQGYARQFRIGQYPSIEGRLDDDIQSVRVNNGLRIVLFEHDKFKGRSIVIDRDTWDLGNFRKKAGSMIIEQIRYGQLR